MNLTLPVNLGPHYTRKKAPKSALHFTSFISGIYGMRVQRHEGYAYNL